MFVKVFIGITIFSLIVGILASGIVGIAVTFDNVSFSPSLVDIDGDILENCDEYRSEECQWVLYDEIRGYEYILNREPLRKQLSEIEEDLINGSNIVITRSETIEGVIEPVFLGRLLSVNPENGDLLCSDFSFQSQENPNQKCHISPYHVKSEVQPDNSTESILVAEILVANHSSEITLCSDFTNKFKCNLRLDQDTQLYKAKVDDIDFNCEVAGGTIIQGTERDICSIKGKRQLVSPQYLDSQLNPTFYRFDGNTTYCTYGIDCIGNYTDPFNTFGTITGAEDGVRESQLFFVRDQNNLLPAIIIFENLIKPNEEVLNTSPTDNIGIGCFFNRDIKGKLECEAGGEVFVEHTGEILRSFGATESPKLFVRLQDNVLLYRFGLVSFGDAKNVFDVIPFILEPQVILGALQSALPTVMILIALNVAIAFIVIILGLWRRLGKRLTTRFALAFKGRIGRMLEMTQFFEFSGDWYLEAIAVHDYNFTGWRPAFKELITERWRDTIFFPVSLAATISVLLVTISNRPEFFWSVMVIAPILPILLSFWTPFVWTMQDSGLKRVNWGETGDVNAIERISNIVRDGFNKLVGIGAILGLGTAGSTAIRESITGLSSDSQFLTASIESLLSFNLNFLVSTGIWTIGLFFLICAASLPGVVLTSLVYLNRGQIDNVRVLRERMKKAHIMFGTSQQVMQDHDVSVYYDSSKEQTYLPEQTKSTDIKSFIDVPDVYEDVSEDREKKLDQAEENGSLDIKDDRESQDDSSSESNDKDNNNDEDY
jgi:hypothetical protein